jgi:hypothetical protein
MRQLFVIAFLFVSLCLFPATKGSEVMNLIEKRHALNTDFTALVKFSQKKNDEGIKVYESVYYRKDASDSYLIIMVSPDNEKGNGYLRVGDNFWMYRMNTRSFQHISRDEDIGDTDVSAGDFEKRKFTELYELAKDDKGKEIFSEEKTGDAGASLYRLEVKSKVKDVKYPKQIYWVTKDEYLITKVESYSLSGSLMSTVYYKKYTKVNDKYLPVQQLFVDEFENGNRTLIELSNISIEKLQDSIFTKAYLENLSK